MKRSFISFICTLFCFICLGAAQTEPAQTEPANQVEPAPPTESAPPAEPASLSEPTDPTQPGEPGESGESGPTQPAPGFDESDYEFISPRALSYSLTSVGSSRVNGYVQVNENLEGGTRMVVTLQGIQQGQRYALQLFRGNCGPDREPVSKLATVPNIEGDPFSSYTDSPLSFDIVTGGDYFLYVYEGADTTTSVGACGEIGRGANAAGTFTPPPDNAASAPPTPATPTPATPEPTQNAASPNVDPEFQSPRTASYYLAPINGSGVEANMQVNEIIGGGTRIITSLSRSSQAEVHTVVIHEANCGPERPVVERLNRIDGSDGDPYVGISNSALDFDTLTQGDHFAYLYQGEPSAEPVACGEVGVGANR